MKKFLAILVCLSLLVGGVFAQTAPTFTGSATLSWGIDFGGADITHGFHNKAKLTGRLPILDSTSMSGGSENKDADVYVDFSGSALTMDLGAGRYDLTVPAGKISASLHFFGAYITVWNTPDFTADLAAAVHPVLIDGDDLMSDFANGFEGWGTTIGYANEDVMGLDVGLKFGSNKTWYDNGYGEAAGADKGTGTGHSAYGIGLDFTMAPVDEYLTIDATVNAVLSGDASTYETTLGPKPFVNFGLALSSSPIEGLDVIVGFDGEYMNDAFGWEVGFDTTYEWANLGVLYSSATGLNIGLGFHASPSGTALPDPVKNLGVDVGLNMYDLVNFGSSKLVDFAVGLSYLVEISDSMTLTPSATFALQNAGNTLTMAYEVGVDYSPMEKVVLGLKWHQGGLAYDAYMGPVSNHLGNHNGTLVFSLTLKY